MKKLILGAAIAVMSAGVAFADTVRMGTEGAYPPYNFVDDNGEIVGFERDLGDELCKRAGLECTWVKNDWDSIIPNLVSGNYDTIIAGMSITAERDEVIDFTQEYKPADPSAYLAVAGTDDSAIDGIVAAQVNTVQSGFVAKSSATLVEFATPDETIAAVKSGEADAVLADYSYLAPIAAESGGELILLSPRPFIGGGVGMGIRESDTELKDKMNAAIDSVKADGTLNALLAKWFPEETSIHSAY